MPQRCPPRPAWPRLCSRRPLSCWALHVTPYQTGSSMALGQLRQSTALLFIFHIQQHTHTHNSCPSHPNSRWVAAPRLRGKHRPQFVPSSRRQSRPLPLALFTRNTGGKGPSKAFSAHSPAPQRAAAVAVLRLVGVARCAPGFDRNGRPSCSCLDGVDEGGL